ncbi:hypothetical protein [Salinicola halophilus]|uniref:hypothetical protein n=1 Tax=Salinicola halophilus TaxID=184065 RepID=UPI0013A680DB|nr:hypothetical protein [Salinicola halophilus]
MARPYIFPDPKDRSPNEPTIALNQQKVLGIYNQHHPEDRREKVTDPVKEWFRDEANRQGWKEATFHGSVCVLSVDVEVTS